MVRDTAADPQRAAAAVDELARLGVAALAGEYHSVVARAAAARADALGLPFLCSSAVLDALTEQPTDWVARLAPAQSHGWRIYADFLLGAGHGRIAVAAEPSVYWAAGTRILRDHLASRGGTVVELDMRALTPTDVCDELVDQSGDSPPLLVGHPEPAVSIVRSVRRDRRLAEIMIGAPAGQPEFADWATSLGDDGAGIPFLRYLPERLSPLGARVETALRERLAERPRSSPSRATTRSPSSPTCCVLTAGRAPSPGRRSRSKAPAGRSGSPARRASASGNGPGRRSRSSIEIRRSPIASGSFTPASDRWSGCQTRAAFAVAVTGPPGSGKTVTLTALSDALVKDGIAHAAVDVDEVAWAYPYPDLAQRCEQSPRVCCAAHRSAGSELLLVAEVIESTAHLTATSPLRSTSTITFSCA